MAEMDVTFNATLPLCFTGKHIIRIVLVDYISYDFCITNTNRIIPLDWKQESL